MRTYHQRPKHVIKWVFSDVDTCFFTNVVCLNIYDIYGVKVVYNAQFVTRILAESVVVSGWLNLYPQCLRIFMYLVYFIDVYG